MKRIVKSVFVKYKNFKNDRFIDSRYINELNSIKGTNYQHKELPEKYKREYRDYYASFGFDNVPLDWVEYIYSVKNDFNVGYVPDPLYHKYIDPYFPFAKYEVADKYLQPFVLSDIVDYPETIVANTNGIYLDSEMNILSIDEVVKKLKGYDEFMVKPSVYNGAGLNVRLFKGSDNLKSILKTQYKKDFIIQKKLEQFPLMAEFNSSSVNTVRILTMLFHGEVYVLCSYMKMGHPGSVVDNSTGCLDNYCVCVNKDGRLAPFGNNIFSELSDRTLAGKLFSDFKIPKYDEMVEIAKKGQKRLAKHKIIAWDIALDKNGKIVVIEYNFKLHPITEYGITCGPVFGNLLNDILKDAAVYRIQRNKYGGSLTFV